MNFEMNNNDFKQFLQKQPYIIQTLSQQKQALLYFTHQTTNYDGFVSLLFKISKMKIFETKNQAAMSPPSGTASPAIKNFIVMVQEYLSVDASTPFRASLAHE